MPGVSDARPLPWDRPGGKPLPGGPPDDGSVDPRLAAALAASDGSPASRAEVLAALAGARVFVAIRAEATSVETPEGGLRRESTAEMSIVCLRSSDGVLAVPVFSDGHEVQRWQADARPVPLPGPQACASARVQGADLLLLDPTGAAFVATAGELRALAEGYVPVPGSDGLEARRSDSPLTTPAVPVPSALVEALAEALRDEPVTTARLLEGPDGLVLGVCGPALEAAGLAALAGRVLERCRAALPPEGLDLTRVEPEGPGQPVPLARRRGLLRRGR
ncbi:MAG: hypothetical protein JWN17_1930 [Frankiales bacterium]|nr:hypothetical protein [Frankiales bacterium]